jgi:hypothetical protein
MFETGNYSFRPDLEASAYSISLHAPGAVLMTTTLATLALSLLGTWLGRERRKLHTFLLLGTLLPIARNLLPGMRNFGGVRHFLEFLPMLCLLAGLGADELWRRLSALTSRSLVAWAGALALLVLAPLEGVLASVTMQPAQILYYNCLVGGLGGAQGRGLRDAQDVVCNTYWLGMRWLSAHAEHGARVIVPRGDFVAAAAAPLVLRTDLAVWTPQDREHPGPWYVMALAYDNKRTSMRALAQLGTRVFTFGVQGGDLLHIYRFGPDQPGWYREHWLSEQAGRESHRRVLVWLRKDPALLTKVMRTFASGREGALAELRPLFPAEFQADLEGALQASLATSSDGGF